MALIVINGVSVPTPSSYDVSINDLSIANRNSLGQMIIERIATKRTLQVSWQYLTASQCSQVLQAVSPTFYDITYLDPQTGNNRTSSFYCGDRSIGMIDFVGGVARYKDVKFTLIER